VTPVTRTAQTVDETVASGGPTSLGARMQQRLEWERALYEAQPHVLADPNDSGRDDALETPPTDREEFGPPRAGEGPEVRSRPVFEATATSRAPTDASLVRGVAPTPIAPGSPELAGPWAAPEGRAARAPATRAVAVQRTAPAPATSWAARAAEPVSMGVVQASDGVRVWLRDRGVGAQAAHRIAHTIRRVVARLGLHLRAFTWNGRRIVDDAAAGPSTDSRGAPKADGDLDILC